MIALPVVLTGGVLALLALARGEGASTFGTTPAPPAPPSPPAPPYFAPRETAFTLPSPLTIPASSPAFMHVGDTLRITGLRAWNGSTTNAYSLFGDANVAKPLDVGGAGGDVYQATAPGTLHLAWPNRDGSTGEIYLRVDPASRSEATAAAAAPGASSLDAFYARATTLLKQGGAANPFALDALANEIASVLPAEPLLRALRDLADGNRAQLTGTAASPATMRGYPPREGSDRAGVMLPEHLFAAPFFRRVEHFRTPGAASVAPSNARTCMLDQGCPLYRTPSRLYPIDRVHVPKGDRVTLVADRAGGWSEVIYRGRRGWLPTDAMSR